MSHTPSDKPNPPKKAAFDTEKLQETVEDIRETAQRALQNPQGPEVQQAVEQTKGFIERNKKAIAVGIVVVVVLRANKRKVAKATAKAVAKELKKAQHLAQLPTMTEIIRDLRMTPDMAYIDHGGNLLHLLRDHDTVITIAGNFKDMTPEEIWEYAQKVLSGKTFKLKALK